MYIVRELAACVLVALTVGVVFLVGCGICLLLKSTFTLCVRILRMTHARINKESAPSIVAEPALLASVSI
jgi:hypothetical protein